MFDAGSCYVRMFWSFEWNWKVNSLKNVAGIVIGGGDGSGGSDGGVEV